MPFRIFILILGLLASLVAPAQAQTIGISLPLSGDFGELGEKFRKGVELAASDLGSAAKLVFADDGCDPAQTEKAVTQFKSADVDIVVGFLCNDAATVAATLLAENKVPVLVSGARSVRIIKDRTRESWNIWRLAPGDDYPVTVAANAIAKKWRDTPFALVDDGTIYGRNFTDQLRFQLDNLGMKPQFSDSFRAAQSTQAGLLRRLQRSGVTSVMIASATLEDLQTIAIDNARLGTGLDILASEALMALPFLETANEVPAGIGMIGRPFPDSEGLINRLSKENILPNQLIFDGYATLQIAIAALGQTAQETTRNLATRSFDTVLGKISFREDGSADYNPYRLLQWDGERFVPEPDETATQ